MYVVTLHDVLGYPTNFASAFFLQKGQKDLSLRLLALILCSNCSNTFNKVLTTIGGHLC